QDRQDARLRAALGDLQRLHGSLLRAAVLARLVAPHRRHAADTGKLQAILVAKAASSEYDRHAGRAAATGIDARCGPPAESNGRLQGVDPGKSVIHRRL